MGFKPRYRRVTVRWGDAATSAGWQPPDRLPGVQECSTTGYLIEETKKCVKVAGSVSKGGMIADITVIPHEMIRRIELV